MKEINISLQYKHDPNHFLLDFLLLSIIVWILKVGFSLLCTYRSSLRTPYVYVCAFIHIFLPWLVQKTLQNMSDSEQ